MSPYVGGALAGEDDCSEDPHDHTYQLYRLDVVVFGGIWLRYVGQLNVCVATSAHCISSPYFASCLEITVMLPRSYVEVADLAFLAHAGSCQQF